MIVSILIWLCVFAISLIVLLLTAGLLAVAGLGGWMVWVFLTNRY